MRTAAWLLLGWLLLLVSSAASARIATSHVWPNGPLVLLVFVAMRSEVVVTALLGLGLGYFTGRMAGAPLGLFEWVDVAIGLGAYRLTGQVVGSGALYCATMAALASVMQQISVYLLLLWQQEAVAFASFANALLLPDALVTALLALCLHPLLLGVESRLREKRQTGLTWR